MSVLRDRARRAAVRTVAWTARRWGRWPQPAVGVDRATGRPVQIPWGWLTEHVLAVGATGTGKTTTCTRLAAAAISRGLPAIIVDLKGDRDLAAVIQTWAAAAGREFLHFELGGDAVRYDPLASGDPSERASKLMGFSAWSEPHYEAVAQDLVHLALRVGDVSEAAAAGLAGVTDLLDVEAMQAAAEGGQVPLPLAREVSDRTNGLPRDQTSALAGLQSRLRGIVTSSAGPALTPDAGRPTVDLHDALQPGGPVVVASLNSMRYGRLAGSVAAMLLEDLRTALSHRPTATVGLCWVDEFEGVAGPGLKRLLSRARSSGVGVMLSTQDLADLAEVSEQLAAQMLSNCRTIIGHRVANPETAEMLSDVVGTDQVWEDTHKVDRDLLGTERLTGEGSRRAVHHYRVHPTEWKRLGRGSALVVVQSEADGPAHVHRTAVQPLRPPAA